METDLNSIASDLMQRSGAMAAAASLKANDSLFPDVDSFVRQALTGGGELMSSCACLAMGSNDLAVNILGRSIIELSIKTHWATLSSENARHLLALSSEQIKAIFMANARTGIAKIVDREGNDCTAEFLTNGGAARGQKQVSVEAMARQAGLLDLYNVFYRFQSMHAHGNDVAGSRLQASSMALNCVGAFSVLLGHLGVRWLLHRDRPDNEEIRALLGLNDSAVP
ncbi:TPA: DUF5677 domain-containing protein [Stenotrophomonas maltophilia]